MNVRRTRSRAVLLPAVVLTLTACAPDPAETATALGEGDWTTHVELEGFLPYDCHFALTDGTGVGVPPDAPYIDRLPQDLVASGSSDAVGIATDRSEGTLTIDVEDRAPADEDLARYDHVAEASLTTDGTIAVATMLEDEDAQLRVPAGTYRVRAAFEGLLPASPDGLDRMARYNLVLWPEEDRPPAVLKQVPGGAPGC
jgi:hypothetical protein